MLNMGNPVSIYNLAENLIRLSGCEPHYEFQIKITGLRQEEMLYEDLLMAEEGVESKPKEIIHGIVPTYKPDLKEKEHSALQAIA